MTDDGSRAGDGTGDDGSRARDGTGDDGSRARDGTDDDAPSPNDDQADLIESTEGIHVVDAGAGTGKTFAVTRRYANVLGSDTGEDGVEPSDVLLVTFTRNAATEMTERIVDQSPYGMAALADAPIQTFHSLCHDVLVEHGFDAPQYLGIDDHVTSSTRIVEEDAVETPLFREFLDAFADDHPEYADVLCVIDDPGSLLGVVRALAAKGVFPDETGWYRNGERHLDGDFDAFEALFDDLNEPRNDGAKQSELRERLGRYGRNRCYLPDAPSKSEIRGDGTKTVPDRVAREAFADDREHLKAFVHDVYHEYLAFALARNYVNFSMLQAFAFVLLCEDHALRESIAFEYVMVDEFQDSSEIQFKLALLLADTANVCVVGDWKQSIYSFQYAAVENITAFDERLERFVAELNDDHERVSWSTTPVHDLELTENYRSTQRILEFAEECLEVPATSTDTVDLADYPPVESLSATTDYDGSRIEAIQHEDEHEAVLAKVQAIVDGDVPDNATTDRAGESTGGGERQGESTGSGERQGVHPYAVEGEDGELRPPTYGDVAVLTRTRAFGRDLLDVAAAYDVPIAYDGGIELFRTDPAKLLLAWLRILESDADRGWAVVLERAGYTLAEVEYVLESGAYPDEMVAFREELDHLETVGALAQRVFARYDCEGAAADVVLSTIQSVFDATTFTRSDLVQYVERGIETGSTHDVHASAGVDSITVQTIHATKGLEHPIVVLANMNRHAFPPTGSDSAAITYEDPIGLRQRDRYTEATGYPYVHDDWRQDVLEPCLPKGYDEERRLLYVAATRAEHHLVFTAGDTPNAFLDALPVDVDEIDPIVVDSTREAGAQTHLEISIPTPEGPSAETPHTLMPDDVFDDVDTDGERTDVDSDGERTDVDSDGEREDADGDADGRGTAFGQRVHDFAEAYALDDNPRIPREDVPNLRETDRTDAHGGGQSTGTASGGDGEKSGEASGDGDDPAVVHYRHVAALLDSLDGDCRVEEDAVLPLTVDGERVTVTGVADLVHVEPDGVEVLDFKTDSSRHARDAYRTQLSVYYHVLESWFPDRAVTASLYWTGDGDRDTIEPRSLEALHDAVRTARDT